MKKSDYIAVFDSGVGGISVLRQLRKELPNERYLYFGDSINAPYGVRTEEEVRQLTIAAAERLISRDVKAFVIACNTATSTSLEVLQERFPEVFVVGSEPAVALAAGKYPGGHVGVMATPVTLKGSRFLEQKAQYDSVCRITPLPAPGLMDLVEAEKYDSPETDALLTQLLAPHEDTLDALVLGCTHYPFMMNSLRRVLGDKVELFDGAMLTTEQTRQALEQADMLYDGPGEVVIENSLPGDRMRKLSRKLAGLE